MTPERNRSSRIPSAPLASDGPYALSERAPHATRHYALIGAPPTTEFRRPAVLIHTHKRRIRALLARRDYVAADEYYRTVRHCYARPAYEATRHFYWKQHRDEVIAELKRLLAEFRLKEANELAAGSIVVIEPEEYEHNLKAPAIQEYLQVTLNFPVNVEQSRALASTAQHVLVKARAGTGKTRAIICKALLAMVEEELQPDQILMLAFNKDAANEMLERMREGFDMAEFSTSKTFHSLAYRIANPTRAIPDDDDVRRVIMEQAMRAVWTPSYRKLVNVFFRMAEDADLLPDKELGPEDYYEFRRSDLKLMSLGGERVKSIGEKWIADYFFEHGIFFDYEPLVWWNREPYHPDFAVKDRAANYDVIAILEHWGVSESDADSDVIFTGGMTARQYRLKRAEKRRFWQSKQTTLIETSLDDMRNGREAFEKLLCARLAEAGIRAQKRPDAELQQSLERRYWNELNSLMLQFVDRAKNRRLRIEDVRSMAFAVPKSKTRMRVFWRLAARVFGAYEKILAEENKMDFQDMLEEAAKKVDAEKGVLGFTPERGQDRVRLEGLRWLLVDEYQDFSPGFDHMLHMLRKHNPGLRLFCVGDDWQTINRFAGSEPVYFQKFTKNLPGGQAALLRINHRSRRAIVDASNRLMEGYGEPGTWLPNLIGGKAMVTCVDKLWLHETPRNGSNGSGSFSGYDDEAGTKYDAGFLRAKTIAICCGLIQSLDNRQASVAILSRTNRIHGLTCLEFKKELLAELARTGMSDADPHVGTVHKFKGLQATLVILPDITAGRFPLLHKNNELMAPFLAEGQDPHEEAMIDERRLFYVALSRATDELWVLSETGSQSPFLVELRLPEVHPKSVAAQPFAPTESFAATDNESISDEIPF